MDKKIVWMMGAVVLLATGSLRAGYLCTVEDGSVSAQDLPCPTKKASMTNIPIKASVVSEQNAQETVRRFYKAFTEKDPQAAEKFLTYTFRSEARERGKKTSKGNRDRFVAEIDAGLAAVKSYKAKLDCKVMNSDATAVVLSCRVDEKFSYLTKNKEYLSTVTLTVVADEGEIKIDKMLSEVVSSSS